MKYLIATILFIVTMEANGQKLEYSKEICDSLNKLKVGFNYKPTKYQPGFKYYDNRGVKNTLIKWTYISNDMGINTYRWRIKCEWLGVTALAWTDDEWIDIATHKAYLDEKEGKIKYYE